MFYIEAVIITSSSKSGNKLASYPKESGKVYVYIDELMEKYLA